MPKRLHETDLQAIETAVRQYSEGVSARKIGEMLPVVVPHRTLQYRLKTLVRAGRLVMEGSGRRAHYRMPKVVNLSANLTAGFPTFTVRLEVIPPLSKAGAEIQEYVRQPAGARKHVSYNRSFLDSYQSNETFYLSEQERERLWKMGWSDGAKKPGGTYARRVLNRLLIDLSWNSSRLEGNTYSLLETSRLLELDEETEGKEHYEAQMILNHKDAIEFLVDTVEDARFNRYTFLNLHALLANNLLPNPAAVGQLRQISVEIGGSVFLPSAIPQLLEECFDQILSTASAIHDPFERAFFVMVQIPYLQPFDDVNKRVSRLAANIPLIQENLSPLSFEDVPRQLYTEAMLGVYELNRVELLRDLFLWAYQRSAIHYAAVRQSLGQPDPFRMKHRATLREIVGTVIRKRMNRKQAAIHISAWVRKHVDEQERRQFCNIAERELLGLHEGNFARYNVRPAEFTAWQKHWKV